MLATLVYILIVLMVIGLVWWIIDYIPVPPPLNRWAKLIIIVLGAIFLIGIMLNVAGVQTGLPVK